MTEKNPLFTEEQINTLREQYNSFERINPESQTFTKLISLLDNMKEHDQHLLQQLVDSDIKFISKLARNRLK